MEKQVKIDPNQPPGSSEFSVETGVSDISGPVSSSVFSSFRQYGLKLNFKS